MGEFFAELLKKVYINQNFFWLMISYYGIAYAEKHELHHLSKASWVLFVIFGVSVIISLVAYTIEYWTKKWYDAKSHRIEYIKKVIATNMRKKAKRSDCWFDDLWHRIKKNWPGLLCGIGGILFLSLTTCCLGRFAGIALSIVALILGLYSSDIEIEEFE